MASTVTVTGKPGVRPTTSSSLRSRVSICQPVVSQLWIDRGRHAYLFPDLRVEQSHRAGERRAQLGVGQVDQRMLQDRYRQLDIGDSHHDLCAPAAGQGLIKLSLGLAHQGLRFGQLTGSASVSAASCAWATSTAAAALATCAGVIDLEERVIVGLGCVNLRIRRCQVQRLLGPTRIRLVPDLSKAACAWVNSASASATSFSAANSFVWGAPCWTTV